MASFRYDREGDLLAEYTFFEFGPTACWGGTTHIHAGSFALPPQRAPLARAPAWLRAWLEKHPSPAISMIAPGRVAEALREFQSLPEKPLYLPVFSSDEELLVDAASPLPRTPRSVGAVEAQAPPGPERPERPAAARVAACAPRRRVSARSARRRSAGREPDEHRRAPLAPVPPLCEPSVTAAARNFPSTSALLVFYGRMATRRPSKGKPAAKMPATKPRRPSRKPPEAYYFTPAFKEVTGGRKPKKTIDFSAHAHACDHGMDPETERGATDIILDWEFDDPFWKDAKKIRVPRRMRVLVPFGKYAKDPGHCFAIYDYEAQGKSSTLLELLQFCVGRFCEHIDEFVDGAFCEGFEVYGDDLWVFSLNA